MIKTLNGNFIPIYIASEDYIRDEGKAPPEERNAMNKMLREAWRIKSGKVFLASDATCFMLDWKSGECIDAIRLPELMEAANLLASLKRTAEDLAVVPHAKSVFEPTEQVRPDRMAKPDELAIHLVARCIPSGGTWKQLPAEDFIILGPDELKAFMPATGAKVGDTFEIKKEVNDKILVNLYPPTPNRDPETNAILSKPMKATIVSIKGGVARVRLDNDFQMTHHFFPAKEDDLKVEATIIGFVDVDIKARKVVNMQMVTDKATYDGGNFGGAIRSVSTKPTVNAKAQASASGADVSGWNFDNKLTALGAAFASCLAIWLVFRLKHSPAAQ